MRHYFTLQLIVRERLGYSILHALSAAPIGRIVHKTKACVNCFSIVAFDHQTIFDMR